MPDLRVLVVGLGAQPEPFVIRTLEAVAASGVSISIARTRPSGATHAGRIEWIADPRCSAADVAWNTAGFIRGGASGRRRPVLPGELSRSSVTGRFDLIYLPWINTAVDRPALFDLGVPVAVSCRGSFVAVAAWNPRRRAFRDALATVFARASGVHCVSRSLQRDAEPLGLAPERATVVYTGVDTTLYRPGAGDEGSTEERPADLRILWVGGLNWKKDVEHALLAVAAVVRSGRSCSLSIVGSGPEHDRARFTCDDLGLGSEVRFLGQVDQQAMPAIHRAHDVLLHSSSTEGVPNVVVEAMASALPVVATDAGGTREAVSDGVEGHLVPVRAHELMAARLMDLADDGRRRTEMGRAGRRRAIEQFDLAAHAASFRAFLEGAAHPVPAPVG